MHSLNDEEVQSHWDSSSDSRKWRPKILAITTVTILGGHEEIKVDDEEVLGFASQLHGGRGILFFGAIFPQADIFDAKPLDYWNDRVQKKGDELGIEQGSLVSLPVSSTNVFGCKEFLLQGIRCGVLSPNTVVAAWPSFWKAKSSENFVEIREFMKFLTLSIIHCKTLILMKEPENFETREVFPGGSTIDVWWMFGEGDFALLTALLLQQHPIWCQCRIRLIQLAHAGSNPDDTKKLVVKWLKSRGLTNWVSEYVVAHLRSIQTGLAAGPTTGTSESNNGNGGTGDSNRIERRPGTVKLEEGGTSSVASPTSPVSPRLTRKQTTLAKKKTIVSLDQIDTKERRKTKFTKQGTTVVHQLGQTSNTPITPVKSGRARKLDRSLTSMKVEGGEANASGNDENLSPLRPTAAEATTMEKLRRATTVKIQTDDRRLGTMHDEEGTAGRANVFMWQHEIPTVKDATFFARPENEEYHGARRTNYEKVDALNATILEHSRNSVLVVTNLMEQPASETPFGYFQLMEKLFNGIKRIVLVRGFLIDSFVSN